MKLSTEASDLESFQRTYEELKLLKFDKAGNAFDVFSVPTRN